MYKFLVFSCGFFFIKYIYCEQNICQNETTTTQDGISVLWSSETVGKSHFSDPLCLDKNKIPYNRLCNETGWSPKDAQYCDFTQKNYRKLAKCPPGFIEIREDGNKLCVLVTPEQSWNDTCLHYGSKVHIFELDDDFDERLIKYLLSINQTKFWLPARRSKRYDPVAWHLPGRWREIVDLDEFDKIEIVQKSFTENCLSVNISSNRNRWIGRIENCKKKLPMLCLFQDKPLIKLACPENYYTTRYNSNFQSTCFSINKFSNKTKKYDATQLYGKCSQNKIFQAISSEKNYIYENLAKLKKLQSNEHCSISVIPGQDFYKPFDWNDWKMNLDKIKFISWDMFYGDGDVLAISPLGWWTVRKSVPCQACEFQMKIIEPEIKLKFDEKKRILTLTLISGDYFWKDLNYDDDDIGVTCFTNAGSNLLRKLEIDKKIWSGIIQYDEILPINLVTLLANQSNSIKKEIYSLKMYGDGPGLYWCEGHTISNFKLMKSKSIIASKENFGNVFAVLVNYDITFEEILYPQNFFNNITNEFRNLLHLNRNENIEFITIDQIDEYNSIVKILFHISIEWDENNDFGYDYSTPPMPRKMEPKKKYDSDDDYDEFDQEIYRIYEVNKFLWGILTLKNNTKGFNILSMNHTEFCLPENLSANDDYTSWKGARIGETIVSRELCLLEYGIPLNRRCIGDKFYGGVWEQLQEKSIKNIECHRNFSETTQKLYEMKQNAIKSNRTDSLKNLKDLILTSKQNLIPADLYYLSNIMKQLNYTQSNVTNDLTIILNNLMYLNRNILKRSQILNSTNQILDFYDNIINQISLQSLSTSSESLSLHNFNDDGTIGVIMPKLMIYTLDPSVQNISGLGLYKNLTKFHLNTTKNDFSDYYIKFIYANQSNDKFLSDSDEELEAASYIPQKLLDRLKTLNFTLSNHTEESPPIRIVITLYHSDILFQELNDITYKKSDSVIMSVSIPGYDSNLPGVLPIFFKPKNFQINETSDICGYWDFSTGYGEWSKDGCKYVDILNPSDPIVLCLCTHLTHFALLVEGNFHYDYTDEDIFTLLDVMHEDVLDIITLIGCSLSLIGILGIIVTAILFKSWREKPSVNILLQLSSAIALQMILMFCVTTEFISIQIIPEKINACILFGASLHYSVLVVFSWMLITAYLQFLRYVQVLGNVRPPHFFLKAFIIGWILPLIPVILVILIDAKSYIPATTSTASSVCYPSGASLYFAVLLPISTIILANLVIFILVIYNIVRGPDGNIRTTERELTLSQLRLSIFLFFLLGLSWIFGLAAATKLGIVFSYLFCLTATIQGFVLFIYFVIMDPSTRKLWIGFFRRWSCMPSTKKDLK